MESTQVKPLHDPAMWLEVHGDVLYRYALLRLRDPDRAEDVVQDTLLAALTSRDRFSDRSSERTWLVGILKHKLIDHLRSTCREKPVGVDEESAAKLDEFFTSHGLWRNGPRGWKGSPEHHTERQEFWEALNRCLAALPHRLAQAFSLREIDGLEGEEIRSVLGITQANLWAMLHRARLQLRKCMEARWFCRNG